MVFQVEWLQSAQDELADAWVQADSTRRQAITAASHVVEQRLRTAPLNEGESRSRGRRFTFVPPLAVTFRVDTRGQTVTVVQVRMYRKRK